MCGCKKEGRFPFLTNHFLSAENEVKGKVVPVLSIEHHAIKAYWGSGSIAPLIL
jgi:hypothetical protein